MDLLFLHYTELWSMIKNLEGISLACRGYGA